jgi:hypothetical protein
VSGFDGEISANKAEWKAVSSPEAAESGDVDCPLFRGQDKSACSADMSAKIDREEGLPSDFGVSGATLTNSLASFLTGDSACRTVGLDRSKLEWLALTAKESSTGMAAGRGVS